jgi:hypothetical protein
MTTPIDPPSVSNAQGPYEPCEECGAPLDLQQRYCVHCAARRGNGANPSSRYFAAMSKRAHRPPVRTGAKQPSGSRAAAVAFFALLPVAVAIGVLVGRSGGDGNEDAILQALREQDAAVATAAPSTAAPAGASATKKSKGEKKGKGDKGGGKVVAQTDNGAVHQITGFEPTKEKTEEDTKIVESNVKQSGSTYIKAQQNLPDVIVVGGNPDDAPALPTGAQP